MKGFFGDAFDFNGDGSLDAMEQAADFGAFVNMVGSGYASDKLEEAGIDSVEFEFMDDAEKLETLEEAGLDMDDLEF